MGKPRQSQGYRQRKIVNGQSVPVGNQTIDKVVLGIRIKRSIGTTNKTIFNKVDSFLEELKLKRDKIVVEAIKNNPDIPFDKFIEWYYAQDKHPKPWDGSSLLLFPHMLDWLEETKKISDRTKESYKGNIYRLYKFANKDSYRVSDLPKLLLAFRNDIPEYKVLFNRIRATCLSFLNEKLEPTHSIYQEVLRVPIWKKKEIVTKREGKHLTPVQIDNAFIKHPNHEMRELIYFLCSTGIRPEEFCRHGFEIKKNTLSIRIRGKKTAHSDRTVPLLFLDFNKDNSHYGFTKDTLNQSIQHWLPGITTQECRRTFYYWAQQSGWEMNHIRYYFGHDKTMTDRYGMYAHQHAERYWVKEDSLKMVEWIRSQRLKFPKPDHKDIDRPRTIEDLESSTAYLKKEDIINHLNNYLEANHPSVFRKLYRVTKLEMV